MDRLCKEMWKERHFKDDGIYKLWQALLYLHPGCPAVSQLPTPHPHIFKNPVSVQMLRAPDPFSSRLVPP